MKCLELLHSGFLGMSVLLLMEVGLPGEDGHLAVSLVAEVLRPDTGPVHSHLLLQVVGTVLETGTDRYRSCTQPPHTPGGRECSGDRYR